MLCHNRFMKFKTNRYHSKNDGIHLELGVMLSTRTLSIRPVAIYIFAHNSTSMWVYDIH